MTPGHGSVASGVLPSGTGDLDREVTAASAAVEDSLRALEYAVVDVETTGGSTARGDRITEIAIVVVDGAGALRERFSRLVNPGRPIPSFISRLTGITDEMVRDAPPFRDVAEEVTEWLRGRIFVAHNVAFDWGFVDRELIEAGGTGLSGRRLCTVRLARRLVPELPRRSLGVLSEHFGIENVARHRALGDAQATALLLGRFLTQLEEREVRDWRALEELLERGRAGGRRRTEKGR